LSQDADAVNDPSHAHDRGRTVLVRHCDVAVIGATPAGLTAAGELSRQGRSVIVLHAGDDTGDDTDDRAAAEHQREEVRRHGGNVLAARACTVTSAGAGRVRVEVVGGHAVVARQVLVATGARDGWALAHSLAWEHDDTDLPASTEEHEWDRRYGGDQVWSRNPNGTLVAEVTGMTPGRALDVGAGEGGDSVWLAEQGWQVTANEISRNALDRVADAADTRGVGIARNHANANAPDPFGGETFDLVSVQYPAIPRTPEDRGVANLLAAVAPGGTLLAVGHDLAPMRAPVDTHTESRMFDADASLRVADLATAIAGDPAWEIEVHETRPRPPGAASGHHVDDEVLRARRRTG
jgi:SAM-dependent methyltransferase